VKLFHLYRNEDQSGVSGTGPVVEGVVFTNGWVALRWLSAKSSICFYQSLEEVEQIHGHGGRTELIVHDFEPLKRKVKSPSDERRFESLLSLIDLAARLNGQAEDPDATDADRADTIAGMRETLDALERSFTSRGSRA
jgi:hypothetical protein